MSDIFKIKMLGTFEISYGDKTVTENINNSKKMWSFLKYVVAFKDKSIAQSDLIEILWPGGNSKDPYNALKNLLYRLRIVFEDNGLSKAKKLIILKNNKFIWNKELKCEFDFLEFEKYVNNANAAQENSEKQLRFCLNAINVFKGDFLGSHASDQWASALYTYYHNMYIDVTLKACEIFYKEGEFEQIVKICQKALEIDPDEESFYENLITAYVKLGKHKEALKLYNKATDRFYDTLGMNVSKRFKRLYREIIQTEKEAEVDLSVIKDDLMESSLDNGAYLCEYEIFKDIYRIEARILERTGQSIYIALISVTDEDGDIPPIKILSQGMKNFQDIVVKNLRKGDVVSRYSQSQFILLLPSITYESGMQVLQRVNTNFKRSYPKRKVKITYTLQPMDNVSQA